MLLYGLGGEVLPVVVFDMWQSGATTYVCSLGAMMVISLDVLVALFRRLGGRMTM